MMAYRAGVELADRVAAIAPIAGSLGGQVNADSPVIFPDTPSAPVAVIAFHGKQDQHVLYDGGLSPMAVQDGRIDLSVDSSVSFWVKANGCDPLPATETQSDGNIIIDTYSGCEGGADVVLVTIVDGGHAWPGASERLVGDDPTQDISANEMMLEFFLAHPKQH
jgi:polyhydroxybutyrate depolymerase